MLETIIISLTLLANGDMEVIERAAPPQHITLQYCPGGCPQPPGKMTKKIYRAKDGKIVLHKTIEQVPVTKMAPQTTMEWAE